MLKAVATLAVPVCLKILPHRRDPRRDLRAPEPRRYNTLLDPGLGFAKDLRQNLELLRGLAEVMGRICLPCVVGPSQKGFVCKVTGVEVGKERT